MLLRALFAIVLGFVAGCGAAGTGAPPADRCATPSSGSVDRLELGAATTDDLAGNPTPFAPLADGGGVTLLRGAQGADMLGFVLRVSGGAAPDCLDQRTDISDTGGARVTSSATPLATYAQPDGTRLTHPLWLPAEYPLSFVVDVAAAGQSLTLHLHLNLTK